MLMSYTHVGLSLIRRRISRDDGRQNDVRATFLSEDCCAVDIFVAPSQMPPNDSCTALCETPEILGSRRSVFDTILLTSGTRVAHSDSRMLKHGQSMCMGPMINTDIAVVWRESDTRCIISWMVDRFRLRLLRGAVVLRNESARDDRVLFAMARQWRAELSGALTRDCS